jgi:hypothetical protein
VERRSDAPLARDAERRILAELDLAGYARVLSPTDAILARITLDISGQRPRAVLAFASGTAVTLDVDDVPPREALGVLAIRIIERLKAAQIPLAASARPPASSSVSEMNPSGAPPISPSASASEPPPSGALPPPSAPSEASAPPARSAPPGVSAPGPSRASAFPFSRTHVQLGGRLSMDGDAPTGAPWMSVGTGLGRGFFAEVQLQVPTSSTTVATVAGKASIEHSVAALGLGHAWSSGPRSAFAAVWSAGIVRYRVEGQASPGYVGEHLARTSFAAGADASLSRGVTSSLALVAGLGVRLSMPALRVRVAGANLSERGLPELHASLGLAFCPGEL